MSPDCSLHAGEIARVGAGEQPAVSDALALHLDACGPCRGAFDRAAVPLTPDGAATLGEDERRRLLRALIAPPRRAWVRPAVAAALALVAILAGWAISPRPAGRPATAGFTAALVEDHIRYLASPERTAGGTREALERRLRSYVDFPLSLPAPPGAELTGVRRCFVLGRRVALGFYRAGESEVSYFVLPAEGLPAAGTPCPGAADTAGAAGAADRLRCAAELGYSVVAWERSGLTYAVVAPDPAVALRFARDASGAVLSVPVR